MDIITEQDRRLVIRGKADNNTVGRIFFLLGILLVVALLPLGFLVHEALFILQILPGTFILVGLPFALGGGKTVVDPVRRTVLLPNRISRSFDEVAQVCLGSHVKTVNSTSGKNEFQRFTVSLLFKEVDPEKVAMFEDLHRKMEMVVQDRDKFSDDVRAKVEEQLKQPPPAVFTAASAVVIDHGNGLRAWQAAERLSRLLHVSMIDTCGEDLVERGPDELDLSLAARLARQGFKPEPIASAPPFIRDESTSDRLSFSWRRPKWGALVFGIVSMLFGIAAIATGNALVWIFGALAVLSGWPCVAILMGRTNNHLEIDPTRLIYYTHTIKPVTITMPTNKLELIRVDTTLHPALNLVSDDRVVTCPMPADAAEWLKARIEAFLVGVA
jgi:hypothetical protein